MRTLILFFGILLISCQSDKEETGFEQEKSDHKDPKVTAVEFINDYIRFINDSDREIDLNNWIDQREDVTVSFKRELKRLTDKAEMENPNIGLGFDPILDAQDSPEIFKYSSRSDGYIFLEGIDWSEFKVVLKLVQQDNEWLIDGSGVVNIPKNKMIKR